MLVSLWGDNLRGFIKAAREEGFASGRRIICSVGGSVEIFVALRFRALPPGIWFGSPYWYEAYDNKINKAFVRRYQALGDAKIPPSYAAYNAYAAVKMYKAAAEKAGSIDRQKVAEALEGLTVTDLPVGPTTFRKEDHQAIFTVAFGESTGKGATDTNRMQGLTSIRLFDGTVTPPASTGNGQKAKSE